MNTFPKDPIPLLTSPFKGEEGSNFPPLQGEGQGGGGGNRKGKIKDETQCLYNYRPINKEEGV
ncbi:MAG: hypothetical protein A2V86_03425 [Deltaproteobacteria bacterium RBG_16_49_23]|nr:MAG: hypothetical protein A2V86_03425 [Deltaproteobacteria bacterium RBG_16_49_23]